MKQSSEWQGFPSLARLLENKPESNRFYGLHSESDTLFDRFSRHVTIAAQVEQYSKDVIAAACADSAIAEAAFDDIERLVGSLENFRYLLDELIREMNSIRFRAHETMIRHRESRQ